MLLASSLIHPDFGREKMTLINQLECCVLQTAYYIRNKPKFITEIWDLLSNRNNSLSAERVTTGLQSSTWLLSSLAKPQRRLLLIEQRRWNELYSSETILSLSSPQLSKVIYALSAPTPGSNGCLSPGMFPQILGVEPWQDCLWSWQLKTSTWHKGASQCLVWAPSSHPPCWYCFRGNRAVHVKDKKTRPKCGKWTHLLPECVTDISFILLYCSFH